MIAEQKQLNTQTPPLDIVVQVVRSGCLDKEQIVFFFCMEFYEWKHQLPLLKTIPSGIEQRYGVSIGDSMTTCHRGRERFRQTCPQAALPTKSPPTVRRYGRKSVSKAMDDKKAA